MNITSTAFVAYAASAIILIIFSFFFLRWVFDIQRRNKHLIAQTKLLAKIAEAQGVPMGEIDKIMSEALTFPAGSYVGRL
jgi:hypothetical protein